MTSSTLYKISLFLFGTFLIASCTQQKELPLTTDANAQSIINQSIEAHGGTLYNKVKISFDFRDKHYTSTRQGGDYEYTRSFQAEDGVIKDVLNNSGFSREIDGQKADLSQRKANAYTNSVNSVLYFAQLPYGLNDAAVIKSDLGTVEIKDKTYHKIQVTFKQEGGGKDYQDVFIYWINQESKKLDYLAYSYETDGGGLRFREAINQREVNGIHFSDYINYQPKDATIHVSQLDQAFNNGQLKELSRIINENVEVTLLD